MEASNIKNSLEARIKTAVRDVPDFPKEGILFKDITPILQDSALCKDIVEELYERVKDWNLCAVAGIESRGFLFGPMLAQRLKLPFVPIRKKGKLPYETISVAYELEYGESVLEMHIDGVNKGDRVMIHDDLLATGGTGCAAASIINKAGAKVVGFSFVIELEFLNGRERIETSTKVESLVKY